MYVKPVHGCYTPHQFHQYVITGERFANDNPPEWNQFYKLMNAVERVLRENESGLRFRAMIRGER